MVQTGVQFLTGFLLTLPFQQRFEDVSDAQGAAGIIAAAVELLMFFGFWILPAMSHRRTIDVAER